LRPKEIRLGKKAPSFQTHHRFDRWWVFSFLEEIMATVHPTFENFKNMLSGARGVALRRRIPADLETPVSAFLKLRRLGASFLLESVERGENVGRYSFIGLSPSPVLTLHNGKFVLTRQEGKEEIELAGADPLDLIRSLVLSRRVASDEGLPSLFAGAVGYLSYDLCRHFERLPSTAAEELSLPECNLLFTEKMVAFDHVKREMEIIVVAHQGDSPARSYERAVAEIESTLNCLSEPIPGQEIPGATATRSGQHSNFTDKEFEESVDRAKEYIFAGDAFQIVLSQRIEGKTDAPPFQVYRALRMLNPSPYMFFLDFGDYQLIGSSPEALVKLEGRTASLRPIAGTRRRGKDGAEDLFLEKELLNDAKEKAEHIMLVDLGRNDLGRVCEYGTVQVNELMAVERYSHVMHMVSLVNGTLNEGSDMFDLLRATFPAGTVSGAPKVRAMEIIEELEGVRRGPYAGAVGYFGFGGNMDMCITIRTVLMRQGKYFAQAGAGVVADSDPRLEYEESLNKIQALLRAVALAEEGI
jgi:anthranilate synthase component 1